MQRKTQNSYREKTNFVLLRSPPPKLTVILTGKKKNMYNNKILILHTDQQKCAGYGFFSAKQRVDCRTGDDFLRLERLRMERGKHSTLAIRAGCDFSKKVWISDGWRPD